MDFDDVWLLPSNSHADFNGADFAAECEKAFQRQKAADRFFKNLRSGSVSPGDAECFFDQLAADDIEPIDYLDSVTENIQLVMADGRPIKAYGMAAIRTDCD